MINSYTNFNLNLEFEVVKIKGIDFISNDVTIIIIDYDKMNDEFFYKVSLIKHKIRIICLDNAYERGHQVYCYDNMVYLYMFDTYIMNEFLNATLNRLNESFSILEVIKFIDDKNVEINDKIIRLPKKEMQILSFLYENKGKICSKEDILTKVLGYHEDCETRLVSVYVRYLRQKLSASVYDIETIRKQGYRIILRSV